MEALLNACRALEQPALVAALKPGHHENFIKLRKRTNLNKQGVELLLQKPTSASHAGGSSWWLEAFFHGSDEGLLMELATVEELRSEVTSPKLLQDCFKRNPRFAQRLMKLFSLKPDQETLDWLLEPNNQGESEWTRRARSGGAFVDQLIQLEPARLLQPALAAVIWPGCENAYRHFDELALKMKQGGGGGGGGGKGKDGGGVGIRDGSPVIRLITGAASRCSWPPAAPTLLPIANNSTVAVDSQWERAVLLCDETFVHKLCEQSKVLKAAACKPSLLTRVLSVPMVPADLVRRLLKLGATVDPEAIPALADGPWASLVRRRDMSEVVEQLLKLSPSLGQPALAATITKERAAYVRLTEHGSKVCEWHTRTVNPTTQLLLPLLSRQVCSNPHEDSWRLRERRLTVCWARQERRARAR